MNNEITRLTGITADEWSQMVFDTGIHYLQCRMRSEEWVRAVSQTKVYWEWYKNQWQIVDSSFINSWGQFSVSRSTQAKLRKEYEARHCVENMVAYPASRVMQAAMPGYMAMMGAAIKEVVK